MMFLLLLPWRCSVHQWGSECQQCQLGVFLTDLTSGLDGVTSSAAAATTECSSISFCLQQKFLPT